MLLHSAFLCDGGGLAIQPQARPPRPKLTSFGAYQPLPLTPTSSNPLSSSCRALQAILGGPAITSQQPPPRASRALGNPSALPQEFIGARQRQKPPTHRSANKRRRSEFEQDFTSDVRMEDCSSTPEPIRTPKRRRKVPLSMPMGLSADDFRSLDNPAEEVDLEMPISNPQWRHSDCDSAYGSSPSPDEEDWTDTDDRMLVDTVLEKLKLSRREWNDCARILGQDRDTLERRWSLLVGNGDVGLRRGGRMSRTSLDISSW